LTEKKTKNRGGSHAKRKEQERLDVPEVRVKRAPETSSGRFCGKNCARGLRMGVFKERRTM